MEWPVDFWLTCKKTKGIVLHCCDIPFASSKSKETWTWLMWKLNQLEIVSLHALKYFIYYRIQDFHWLYIYASYSIVIFYCGELQYRILLCFRFDIWDTAGILCLRVGNHGLWSVFNTILKLQIPNSQLNDTFAAQKILYEY